MYKFLLCSIFFITASITKSQDTFPADSLLKAADTEKEDSARMKIYNRLGKYYMDNNAGKAIEYFEKAKAIAEKEGRLLNVANNFYSIGFCYLVKADFEKSLYNYQQSIKGYENLKDSFRLSNALMSVGNVYSQSKDISKTIEYYRKAEQLVLAMNDSLQLSNVYDVRGTTYDQLGKFDSALLYLQKAYDFSVPLDSNYAMGTLSNIGLTYKHIRKTAEALRCFETVLEYFKRTKMPVFRVGMLYNNIAATYSQAGSYAKALEAFNKSIELAKEAGSVVTEMENYRNMADMFANMKNFEQQASYLQQYHRLKDSIFTIDNKNQLTQLEADYQLEKKNAEIVKKEAELVKEKSQRNIFIIIALAAAALLAALGFFYQRTKNINKALTEKNIQINEQKNELQTLNQVKDRLFSIISHDLRNPITTLRSYLSLADNDQLTPEKKKQFKLQTMNAVMNTSDMLDNLLAWANVQIKNIRASITPISVPDCVWDTVHNVQAQALQKGITIHQQITAETALGDYDILSIALRNIATNAIKFSSVQKNIYIRSVIENNQVLLTVQDEGMGMSAEKITQLLAGQIESTPGTQGERGSGLGLFLVKELLEKINAALLIESEIGKGSCFTIVLAAV